MPFGSIIRGALLALSATIAVAWPAGTLQAATFLEFSDPNPAAGNQFGSTVVSLSTGNVVITSPFDDAGGSDAGAAYLFNGSTGALISTLLGSAASDQVGGGGVTALSNGNFVVSSPNWDNGAVSNAGAVTVGGGTTGVSGVISAANSLVGSTASDQVGSGGLTALSNGNFVVRSSNWDNGAAANAGAVTWGNGTTGVSGAVSAANSLVGSTSSDNVGSSGGTALSNGNYVVMSQFWDNGAAADAGAATWGSGTTGVIGVVSAANSLVGSTANDQVGGSGVTALSNGNYVVASSLWDNGAVSNAGAASWGSGTTGVTGVVSAANSLVGSTASDQVGGVVTALSNGNYVVASSLWDNGAVSNAGAVTWGSGTTGVSGAISAANSLVGSTSADQVGSGTATALSNGNYVVLSSGWDNGAVVNAGAATWGSGTTGVSGAVSVANSLVGSTANDNVGGSGVTTLSNGNYVVRSANWDNSAVANAGAASWGSGTTGVSGVVSSANSLVGSTTGDNVGNSGTALSDGNYVVRSANWDNGAVVNVGAATWGSGTAGMIGVVSSTNSLVAATANAGLGTIVEDTVNGTFFGRFVTEVGGRVRVGPLPRPVILSAADILNDQGGWLRLTFARSALDDAAGSPPGSTYGIWRHVPGTIPAGPAGARRSTGLGSRPAPEIAAVLPPGTWELVTSVPALQQVQYVVAVPTISNAAANDFVVTAHTTTPSIWFVCDPVSGQSADNLAPAQPTQLTASYSGTQTDLQWAANTENDLGSYRVYRGTSAGFTPGPGNQIAAVVSASHADVGPAGSFYKVSAVDVNDNESGFALVTPGQTTGVDGEDTVAFALEGVRPNPSSRDGLYVTFALPTGEPARLELLDVSGRRILRREVGSLGVGRHTVSLAQGRRVSPGIYWVRLTQGANQGTTRAAVIE